jgi:muconolactone D-isomerase
VEEFFVELEFTSLDAWPAEERDALRTEESDACVALWDEGTLLRVWRIPDQNASISIWCAESATELDGILRGLPFARAGLLGIKVTSLARHPIEAAARTRAAAGVEGARRHPWP